jgi:hypothetical protein
MLRHPNHFSDSGSFFHSSTLSALGAEVKSCRMRLFLSFVFAGAGCLAFAILFYNLKKSFQPAPVHPGIGGRSNRRYLD